MADTVMKDDYNRHRVSEVFGGLRKNVSNDPIRIVSSSVLILGLGFMLSGYLPQYELPAAVVHESYLASDIEPTALYHEYYNLHLMKYSYALSYAVDVLIVLFGIASVGYYVRLVKDRRPTIQDLMYSVLSRVGSALVWLLVVAICLFIMVATTVKLSRFLGKGLPPCNGWV